MPWAKLCDGFWNNQKVLSCEGATIGFFACCLSFCAKQRNDGRMKKAQMQQIMVTSRGKQVNRRRACEQLVEAGLIVSDGDCWAISNWLEYNPSRIALESKTQLSNDRVEAYRQRLSNKKHQRGNLGNTSIDRNGVTDQRVTNVPDPTPKPHGEIPPAFAADANPAPPAAAAFSTSSAKPSAAERQVAPDPTPPPAVSPVSAPPQAASPPAPASEPGPEPARPAQANLAPRTQPAVVAGPLPGSLSLADAYDAQRREWLTRRVASVPDGVPLSAGQLTLALCQDLQLGIDINIGGRHRAVIGELAGSATATHLQLAWVETVAAASAKRDQPGLGLMLKILARVARQQVMPQTHDDWALDGAADNVSFTLEFRRKVAAMRAEEEAEAARKAAGVR